MTLIAPPLFIDPLGTFLQQGWDAANFSLGAVGSKGIAQVFTAAPPPLVAQKGGVRLARYLVNNPYDRPVSFYIPPAPTLKLSYEHARVYLRTTDGSSGCTCDTTCACPTYACKYDLTGTTVDKNICLGSAPADDADTTVVAKPLGAVHQLFEVDDKDSIVAQPLAPNADFLWTIPAKDSLILDLLVETEGECLIGKQSFTWIPPKFPLAEPIDMAIEVAGASCSAPGPTADDDAQCIDNIIFGCSKLFYRAPRILTQLAIGADWPEGPTTYDVTVHQYVPGFGKVDSYKATRSLDVEYTTSVPETFPDKPYFIKDDI